MNARYRIPLLLSSLFLATSLIFGCNATPETTPTSATTPTTTPVTPSSSSASAAFTLSVLPQAVSGFTIAGQRVVFLVMFVEESHSDEAVRISATAANATVTVQHPSILAGEVAEVVVVPETAATGKTVSVQFKGERGSQLSEQSFSFDVIEGEDDRQVYALELQAKFVSWLASEHPELNIGKDTVWTGTMVSPQWLVVSHYLFFSEEWEMHIEWHIMVAPYDWARIDLRHRYDETRPSYAFEISSVSAANDPVAITPPDSIWR